MGIRGFVGGTRLDFDEDERVAVGADQIDFAGVATKVASKNAVPAPPQVLRRRALAAATEHLPLIRRPSR